MKNIITPLALLFLFSASASALCDSTKRIHIKHELGMVFYSNQLEYFTVRDKNAFSQNLFSGIQYKMIINRKNALRASFQYMQKVTNFEMGGWMNYSKENSLTKNYEIRTGYERIFGCGKLKPFGFADLSYSYGETQGYREWNGDFTWGAGNFSEFRNTEGITVGGGIKYFPRRNIFLSIETSVGFNLYQTTTAEEGNDSYTNKFHDWVFNPIKALSFGVKF